MINQIWQKTVLTGSSSPHGAMTELFLLPVLPFTVMTHWADCCVFSSLRSRTPMTCWSHRLRGFERSRLELLRYIWVKFWAQTSSAVYFYLTLHIEEQQVIFKTSQPLRRPAEFSSLSLMLKLQLSDTVGGESDRLSCSALVSVGPLVSGQRIQFVQINDGSQSSVSNKVMGTDAEREDRERVTDSEIFELSEAV